jgi:8-oxo-dGTP pyrophosphatase MutT (NUDIX family)
MAVQKQVAALPVRRIKGKTEVLLVTSRDTGRWIIPKGWHAKGLKGHESAAREAKQEAGVEGKIDPKAIGHFRYVKTERSDQGAVDVTVFLLSVRKVLKRWREAAQRERAWFPIDDAAESVQEPELSSIISALK